MPEPDNAARIQHEGFRRAVNTQIDCQRSLVINDTEFIRVFMPREPAESFPVIVIVVNPVKGQICFATDSQQFRMLNQAVGTPGRPDINQAHLTRQIG